MVKLYSDFYEKQYKVACCSCITYIWCIFFLAAIFGPFLLAYSAGGFWIKEQTYFEHANVRFGGDIIIGVLDEDGRSGVHSTILEIN